jgi:hypothetical protein
VWPGAVRWAKLGAVRDLAYSVLFVGVVAALAWLGWRYEPHWCSKDGRRFTCRVRPVRTDLSTRAEAERHAADRQALSMANLLGGAWNPGRSARATGWREARAFVDADDGTVQLVTRVGALRRPLAPARLLARGAEPRNRRWVYVVDTEPMRELRVPVSSRAVPGLDDLVERATGVRPTP